MQNCIAVFERGLCRRKADPVCRTDQGKVNVLSLLLAAEADPKAGLVNWEAWCS